MLINTQQRKLRNGERQLKSLEDFIKRYKPFGMSDLEIIQNYFTENNLESAALELITILAKSQTDKVQKTLDYARTWIPNQIDMSEYIKDKTQLRTWNAVVNYYLLSMDLPDYILTQAQNEIPKLSEPKCYFVPAYDWLKSKYNIKFKDDKGEK